MHGNIYMDIIFIDLRVKIKIYTGKYSETLSVLLNILNFSGFTINYPNPFFAFTVTFKN